MSLHDVIIELLYSGFPKTEEDRDRLLAAVRDDQAAQAYRDGPKLMPPQANTPPEAAPTYDSQTGERLT